MRAHYRNVIQDTAGNLVTGASVAVFQPGTQTPISATLYADGSSGSTLANPYTSANGVIDFYLLSPQRVDIGVTPPGGSQLIFSGMDVEQPYTSGVDVTLTGAGLEIAEGSNAKQGTATLSSGTVVVANTSVTASSRIFLTAQDNSSVGALRVSARTPGTSFTITSSGGSDSGVVAYEIFEPG